MAGEWYFAFSYPPPRWCSKSPWTRPHWGTPTWISRGRTEDPPHLSHGKSRVAPTIWFHTACVDMKSLDASTVLVSFHCDNKYLRWLLIKKPLVLEVKGTVPASVPLCEDTLITNGYDRGRSKQEAREVRYNALQSPSDGQVWMRISQGLHLLKVPHQYLILPV